LKPGNQKGCRAEAGKKGEGRPYAKQGPEKNWEVKEKGEKQ